MRLRVLIVRVLTRTFVPAKRIVCKLTFWRRLVARLEWLRDWPKLARLPVSWSMRDISIWREITRVRYDLQVLMLRLLFQEPMIFAVWLLAFLISLSVHEFAHALVGNYLGDQTAKRLGRLTLNPAAHVDPLGLLTVTLIGFGWGKPVPYNPYNLRWQKWGPAAIAFAGPTSNLVLAVSSAVLFGFIAPHLGLSNLLSIFLMVFAQINIALFAFNLVPLPPLDGSKLLLAGLSAPKYHDIRQFIETKGSMVLLILVLVDSFANLGIFSAFIGFASRIVLGIADAVTRLF